MTELKMTIESIAAALKREELSFDKEIAAAHGSSRKLAKMMIALKASRENSWLLMAILKSHDDPQYQFSGETTSSLN